MKKHAMENDLPEQKPKTKKAKLAELLQFSSSLQLFSKRPRSLEYQIYTVATTKGRPGSNFLIVAMEELWVH